MLFVFDLAFLHRFRHFRPRFLWAIEAFEAGSPSVTARWPAASRTSDMASDGLRMVGWTDGRMDIGWTLDGHRCSHWMLSRCFAKARDSNDAAIVGLVLPVTKLLSQDLTTSTPFQSIPVPKRKSKLEWQQSNQDQPRSTKINQGIVTWQYAPIWTHHTMLCPKLSEANRCK